jgi:hypothetical protein
VFFCFFGYPVVNLMFFETIFHVPASNRINGGKKMKKLKFKYRFKHLEEKFNPSSDLGNYEIYNPETLFLYK